MKKNLLLHLKRKFKASSTLVYALMCIIILVNMLSIIYRYNHAKAIAENIEDAITSSLLGSAKINLAEYGKTRQVVIFKELPLKYDIQIANYIGGENPELYIPNNYNYFNMYPSTAQEFNVNTYLQDENLLWSYNKFIELLKINLNLDDNMIPLETTKSGRILTPSYVDKESGNVVSNRVRVEEYTVINKYKYRESISPYTEHTYTTVYRSEDGGPFQLIEELSGVDVTTKVDSSNPFWSKIRKEGKSDGIEVNTTSVYARISFYYGMDMGIPGGSIGDNQIVDRIVSIEQIKGGN